MLVDQRRLSARIHGIGKIKSQEAQQAVAAEIQLQIEQAQLRVENRKSAVKDPIVFSESLPVSQRKAEIQKLLSEHQVIVVAGETGSGKTTQLPKMCLELGFGNLGMIGHTQPRRIAARSVAARIAEELETELGGLVGYKVRFNDQISDDTQIKLMTDGILLAEIQNDSLRAIINARDNEVNDMMATMNLIQQGFAEINAAENRVTLAKEGERADKATQIKENIQFITQRMQENRELIKKLQQQLQETGFKGEEMKKTLVQLTAQLAQKDNELKVLRAELASKNIHIKELDQTISGLNTDVSNLKTDKANLTAAKQTLETEKANLQTESKQKSETISTQDMQLNTGWYVFGTKRELREQRILADGKVLQGSFNKNYFTKIDIRSTREVKLYSKSAKLLTAHPSSSYSLTKDAAGQYVLRINDPQTFWSTSKYLVVQVR